MSTRSGNQLDVFSLCVGWLGGVATTAAGNYFAHKYTDVRRDKETRKEQRALWKDLERKFPAVIAEMRNDFSQSDGENVRAFFVKESGTILGGTSEPAFEYHTDKHADLIPALLYLEQHGFISALKKAPYTPMYRVHEKLVDALLKRK